MGMGLILSFACPLIALATPGTPNISVAPRVVRQSYITTIAHVRYLRVALRGGGGGGVWGSLVQHMLTSSCGVGRPRVSV